MRVYVIYIYIYVYVYVYTRNMRRQVCVLSCIFVDIRNVSMYIYMLYMSYILYMEYMLHNIHIYIYMYIICTSVCFRLFAFLTSGVSGRLRQNESLPTPAPGTRPLGMGIL